MQCLRTEFAVVGLHSGCCLSNLEARSGSTSSRIRQDKFLILDMRLCSDIIGDFQQRMNQHFVTCLDIPIGASDGLHRRLTGCN